MSEAAANKTAYDNALAALNKPAKLPDVPSDCRLAESAGIKLNDRLDVAVVKYDQALTRANNRVDRCWKWYKRVTK